MKRPLFTLSLCLLLAVLGAQDLVTITYAKLPDGELDLDLYLPPNTDNSRTPLVIFVHGGGFSGGTRGGGKELGQFLSMRGVAVASISYTLYMKGRTQDWGCDGILTEKIKAIQLAANETWLATQFLLRKADTYKIDPEKIFLAGASAGAETVLHAAYWDRSVMQLIDHNLNADFRYAGVISGAGAIMDINLITEKNAVPTMLFHGDQDPIVPYATAAHHYCPTNASGWLMLFGSRSIARHLADMDRSYLLSTSIGGGHAFCIYYFRQEMDLIATFIEQVNGGTTFKMEMTVD